MPGGGAERNVDRRSSLQAIMSTISESQEAPNIASLA
jgi:hypothetical protein